jgi:cytochrome c553
MSRTHLSSNTLLLWLSLSAAATACLVGVGCSSSDNSDTPAAAGKGGGGHSGGSTAKAGSDSVSEAGDSATGGVPDEPDETGEGGHTEPAGGGKGGKGGSGGTGNTAGGSTSAGGTEPTGEAGETGEGGAGGSPDPVETEVEAAQKRAIALINGLSTVRKCTTCHQIGFEGAGFFANITPDVETGIGSWSEDDIKVAIRDGKDKDGNALCATMERYASFSEEQLSDLAIYLKHLTPVKKKITGKCP